jgi:hypothetical protein
LLEVSQLGCMGQVGGFPADAEKEERREERRDPFIYSSRAQCTPYAVVTPIVAGLTTCVWSLLAMAPSALSVRPGFLPNPRTAEERASANMSGYSHPAGSIASTTNGQLGSGITTAAAGAGASSSSAAASHRSGARAETRVAENVAGHNHSIQHWSTDEHRNCSPTGPPTS